MELAGEQATAAGSPLIADVPPGKPAVIMADGSRPVTYGELEARSRQVARLLASLGVGVGDHVAIMMANRPEYFEIAWGAQRAGTYWTPVNWHLTAEEAAYIVADCGASVVFASPETAEAAARLPGVTVFAHRRRTQQRHWRHRPLRRTRPSWPGELRGGDRGILGRADRRGG